MLGQPLQRLGVAFALATGPIMASAQTAETPATQCASDLSYLQAFLLENDTGAPVHWAQKGAAHFEQALRQAQGAAAHIASVSACHPVLRAYLHAWRSGHLGVRPAPGKEDAANNSKAAKPAPLQSETTAVDLQLLSPQTLVLRLKSFHPKHTQAVKTMLEQRRQDLQSHPNWIIDVRGNDGGSDSTYAPVLPWLLVDETVSHSVEWLATPINRAAHAQVCELMGNDTGCLEFMAPVNKRLHDAKDGSYVRISDNAVRYEREDEVETKRPHRVAVLVDKACVSSCEQFLLAARQSYAVKLVGQPSRGALDYSNLRPHTLPSGNWQVWYATTRSTRLPDLGIDGVGVQPDVYLPTPANAGESPDLVARVQRWLEGGSLKP